jgi:hypothetical protein
MRSPRCGFRHDVGAAAPDTVEEAHHERGVAHAQLFFYGKEPDSGVFLRKTGIV